MDVRQIVERIVNKYRTRSPHELADRMGIIVSKCELGSIRGYYLKKYRIKQIILNCNLSEMEEKFVLAHEIGHSVMHEDLNTPFLMESTYFSKNKFEVEANRFAAELLIPDNIIYEHPGFTVEQLSRLTGYKEKVLLLKCKINSL